MAHPFIKVLEMLNGMEVNHVNCHHEGVLNWGTYPDCDVCKAIKDLRLAIYNYENEPKVRTLTPESLLGIKVVTHDWLPDNGVFYVNSNTWNRLMGVGVGDKTTSIIDDEIANIIKAALKVEE